MYLNKKQLGKHTPRGSMTIHVGIVSDDNISGWKSLSCTILRRTSSVSLTKSVSTKGYFQCDQPKFWRITLKVVSLIFLRIRLVGIGLPMIGTHLLVFILRLNMIMPPTYRQGQYILSDHSDWVLEGYVEQAIRPGMWSHSSQSAIRKPRKPLL